MSSRERGHFLWRISGVRRGSRRRCFPRPWNELIPVDHMCRVMEAFVGRLNMAKLGFVRAEPAETGRPGYDPRDLLRALEKLQNDPEPEARFMRMGSGHAPAYNVQTGWMPSTH